jgi:iron complex outermembrane receptor protein
MIPDSANLAGYNKIGATKSNQLTFTATTSLFMEWTLAMPHDFSLTAGLGYSCMSLRLNNRMNPPTSAAPSVYNAEYNNLFAPHVALNKVVAKELSLYAAFGMGYRAPTSSAIYIPATGTVNTALKPETGKQVELGTKGVLLHNKLAYQLAAFYTRFSDKMTNIAVPLNGTTTAYTYTANAGSQNDAGIELQASYAAYRSAHGFISSVVPFGNLTYSHFRYKGFQFQSLNSTGDALIADYDGMAVAGVAPFTANAGMDFMTRLGVYGNLNYNYRDAMPITSDGANNTKAYSLWNAQLGYRNTLLNKPINLDVFFGLNNMTNTQYYNMVFLNQLPDAYMPAPKRNYYVGVNVRYGF